VNTAGRQTVREAQLSSGIGRAREANVGSRKATGNRARQRGTSAACPDNRPDTGAMPDPKGCPRGLGESVEQARAKTPEPMDKLDTPGTPRVNGPEDELSDWQSIDWKTVENDVRRLRQRIFTASREGDLKKVRNLQKLMLRSRSNALVAVRRVAEVNAGRKTLEWMGILRSWRVPRPSWPAGRSHARTPGNRGRSSACTFRRVTGNSEGYSAGQVEM
jgi:hypothetical protein